MESSMNKVSLKLLQFLRDPAVTTIIEIIGLLLLIGGTILGWFNSIIAHLSSTYPWLIHTQQISNWQIVVFTLLFSVIIFFWIRTGLLQRRRKPFTSVSRTTYRKVWGVLWGWPPIGGRYIADGPLCPKHMLPLKVEKVKTPYSKGRYDFVCPGFEGQKGHTIKGPEFSQLVPSDSSFDDPSINKDVHARLKAEDLVKR
jgi:hypothetical protein